MQSFVPEADDEKGSIELLAEIVIQVIVMFLGILITSRIVSFVPTYSGMKYEKVSITDIILAVLMITLSLQTKLGEKVSIIYDRCYELIMGKKEGMENGKDGKEGVTDKKNYKNMTRKDITHLQNAQTPNQGISVPNNVPTREPMQPQGTNAIRDLPNGTGTIEGMEPMGGSPIMAANEVLGGAW